MNKEFIPYEQALELKELGFDELCFFAFDNCSTPIRCTNLRTNEQRFNGVNYNSSSYTSQPTFSQAFRWFEDKHQIFIERIVTSSVNEILDIRYRIISWKFIPIEIQFENPYDCFDRTKSDLACLKKIIEIVKQK